MTEKDDINRFSEIGRELEYMKDISTVTKEIVERSKIYLEFLAGAYIKATNLDPRESELVVKTDFASGETRFFFRRITQGPQ